MLVEMSAEILCSQKQSDADIGCIYLVFPSPNSIPRLLNFHETKKISNINSPSPFFVVPWFFLNEAFLKFS